MATLDELIGSWALSLRVANRAPHTVAQYVDESLAQFRRWMAEHEALRLFFAWAAEEGEVGTNPRPNVKPLIVPEQPVPVLTDDELRARMRWPWRSLPTRALAGSLLSTAS